MAGFYEPPQQNGGGWFTDPNLQANPSSSYGYHPTGGFMTPAAPSAAPSAYYPSQQPPPQQAGPQQPTTSFGFDGAAGNAVTASGSLGSGNPYDNEPPLLVELGVDFTSIAVKTRSALIPMSRLDPTLMQDGDLAGPLVFCLALGFLLLLGGKLHMGYVFGFAVVGSISTHVVLNLMSPESKGIEMHVVVSTLGYALLPIVLLSALAVVMDLRGTSGMVLGPFAVLWCTVTSTRFFEAALDARSQRYLIAYPNFLFFACFALITVF